MYELVKILILLSTTKGIKKKQVYNPNANGGKGGYTKYADAKDKAYGEHLRNSGEKGAAQFLKLIKSPHPVDIRFEKGTGGFGGQYHVGQTDLKYDVAANGDIKVKGASIVIYEGAAENFTNDAKSGKLSPTDKGLDKIQQDDVKTVRDNKLNSFDVGTATLGHEIDHADDQANTVILANELNGTPLPNVDSEFIPRRTTNTILHDLIKPL